ncbi:MAG: trypsin-like peptidase domain-containing protein [Verrucomicrobiae bacterium]|nr:trypsin-like peptidase domain-containing protein [Verrucomicrobiae bacterium]
MNSYSKICRWSICLALACALCWTLIPETSAKTDYIEELRERQAQVQMVAKEAMPAVVALTDTGMTGAGSGVIVSADGLIMTASHVLDALPDSFVVTLIDGTELSAQKLGASRTYDAALAQITDPGTYPFVPLAKSVDVGDWCIAIGHHGGPQADRTPPVRLGKVWAKGRRSGFLTTDCLLSGGDSGGPLFNLQGEVIGIHSSISANASENRHAPVTAFHDGWDRMKRGETWGKLGAAAILEDSLPWAPRGRGAMLGVQLAGNSPTVMDVLPGTAAEQAGIQPGDVIAMLEETPIDTTLQLQQEVATRKPGDKVKVAVERNGKTLTLDVTLGGQS